MGAVIQIPPTVSPILLKSDLYCRGSGTSNSLPLSLSVCLSLNGGEGGGTAGMASSTFKLCCAVASPGLLASSRSKFFGAVAFPNVGAGSSRFTMSAEWMPGQPRPPYLDGSAPGYVLFPFSPVICCGLPSSSFLIL